MAAPRAAALAVAAVLLCGPPACPPASAGFIPSFAGPYIAYVRHFLSCGGDCDAGWPYKVRVTHFNPVRPNELQRITGFSTIGNETGGFNDVLWGKVVMDLRSNNQWKENAFIFSMPNACSNARKHIPDVYRVFFGGRGLTGKCNILPGVYNFTDEATKWQFPHFPVIPYGEYRFRLSVGPTMGSAPAACVCAVVVTIPRASRGD